MCRSSLQSNVISDSVKCYSKIHDYHFILVRDSDYIACNHKDKFFRRHCITAQILPKYDAVMFLDADIGVVNPKRKIEEFLSDEIDVVLYYRFYNWEIAAGSYIVKNTPYALEFLKEWADYESKLPKSFHGTDNGAIHLLLAEKIFTSSDVELEMCRKVYNISKWYDDLFTYEACIKNMFGSGTDFGKIRIMKKGTGWTRDCWLTSCQWHPETDFMLHGWKSGQLKETPVNKTRPNQMSRIQWYNPFLGPMDLLRCNPENTTWSYNLNLLGSKFEITNSLRKYEEEIAMMQAKSYARIVNLLEPNKNTTEKPK
ncbi:hypothetical protein GCK72_019942 [Caenorhabditis remanei]|uniref:Nucleotide-diphospho-sugar transferase domain-containing protein n=1 Tax=Caenorhabditis remanei TaxID=31234 RepID=A0A6A5GFB4_CAERE|nr:hypothetical protein GCK72_019942 [Caenorhabditis remanei]KAF1753385.1 hypothetical protein GCK72_019942 [Caenorhabditis remanei]